MIALAALAASCGGGGGSSSAPTGTATEINSTSAHDAAVEASSYVPICTPSGAKPSGGGSDLLQRAMAMVQQRHSVRVQGLPTGGQRRAMALTSTQPADVLGTCGGRYGYTRYSHVNGVTTATLTFSDYCEPDSSTGRQEVVNGSLSFVNTATSTASGPISTKFEGSSTGLTAVVRSGSSTVSSETVAISDLVYTVGVPGGDPTATNPDRMTVGELKVTDNRTGKVRRQTGVQMSSHDTATGGSQVTLQARGYRSNGEYFDMTTSTPIVTNASGDYTGGALTFNGSGGSNAVLTLVPGSELQATLSVNGKVDTTLPACK